MADLLENEVLWPEAIAEVISCTYEARAGRALAFGLPSKKHFHIRYNYRVGDALHLGECFSEQAIPQGSLFPIRYDPTLPQRSRNASVTRGEVRKVQLALAITGSMALLLGLLLLLHGCA